MTPSDFARVKAIAHRIHTKRHAGWNCSDMHEVVHEQHMAAFHRQAMEIVELENGRRASVVHRVVADS